MEVVALGIGVVLIGLILAVLAVAWILRSPFLWGQFQDVIADMTRENQELRVELAGNDRAIRELRRELQRAELRIDRLQQHAEDAAMHSELLAARLRALGQLDIPPTPQPPPRPDTPYSSPEPLGFASAAMSETELTQAIGTHFDIREINDLAFQLGIEPDEIEGETRPDRARALVRYMKRRKRLSELIALCRSLRPEGGS